MADFSSSGIWDNRTGVMRDYENLHVPTTKISTNLWAQFVKWIQYYDTCFKKDYSTLKPNKSKKLNEWGRELAHELHEITNVDVYYVGEDETGILEPEKIN